MCATLQLGTELVQRGTLHFGGNYLVWLEDEFFHEMKSLLAT